MWLHNRGESFVDCVAAPWVEIDDYWDVYGDVTREVKMRFDRDGIGSPFPQRDAYSYQTAATPEVAASPAPPSPPERSSAPEVSLAPEEDGSAEES